MDEITIPENLGIKKNSRRIILLEDKIDELRRLREEARWQERKFTAEITRLIMRIKKIKGERF